MSLEPDGGESGSVAVTVPMADWFSATLKVIDDEENAGASLTFATFAVIFCVVVLVPSLAVTVAV